MTGNEDPCKGPTDEELAAAAAVAKAQADLQALLAKQAAIAARNAATVAAEKQDDTTKISEVPIDSTGNPSIVTVEGLFIPKQAAQTSEDVPLKNIEIKEDVLLHTSGFIQARFRYILNTRAKIVYLSTLDGRGLVDNRITDESWVKEGTNLPYGAGLGYLDENILQWPNHAWAKTAGPHTIHLKVGLVDNIVEGDTKGANEGLGLLNWDQIHSVVEYDFPVNFIPRTDMG